MRAALLTLVVVIAGCGPSQPSTDAGVTHLVPLPAGFPVPKVPEDNALTTEKVELGRRLFYDVRLSRNRKQSCGTCHEQKRAFTDGRVVAKAAPEKPTLATRRAAVRAGGLAFLTRRVEHFPPRGACNSR